MDSGKKNAWAETSDNFENKEVSSNDPIMTIEKTEEVDVKDTFEKAGINFNIIPVERTEEVLEFLGHNFFPDEPLMRSLEISRNTFCDTIMTDCIKSGSCLYKTGTIIGVRLSEIIVKDSWVPWLGDRFMSAILPKIAWMFSKKLDRACKVFYGLFDLLDYDVWPLFDQFNCNKILGDICVCTQKDSRTRGLGTELVRRCEIVGKDQDCGATVAFVSGLYSGKVFRKSGYTVKSEVQYADYRDPSGELYLSDTREHTSCFMAVKQL